MTIDLEVLSPTRTVVLHAHQLTISDSTTLCAEGGARLCATSALFDFAGQTVTFGFADEVAAGRWSLSTAFRGVLNDELAGFYRSRYTVRGEVRNMALTQFEATDARRCFPCVDEVCWIGRPSPPPLPLTTPFRRAACSKGGFFRDRHRSR